MLRRAFHPPGHEAQSLPAALCYSHHDNQPAAPADGSKLSVMPQQFYSVIACFLFVLANSPLVVRGGIASIQTLHSIMWFDCWKHFFFLNTFPFITFITSCSFNQFNSFIKYIQFR